MATVQTNSGRRGATAINPCEAGVTATEFHTHSFSAAFTASGNILEFFPLPAMAQLLSLEVIGVGVGAITATVGLMEGEPGDAGATRALASPNLITTGSVNNAVAAATRIACLGIAPSNRHRAIGVVLSGNVAADAADTLTVVASYRY